MKKKLSVLMAGTMIATTALGSSPVAYADTSSLSVDRISGKDRFETCANISAKKFGKSETVIIASGETYPDALSSGILSIKHNAPLLLVKQNEIPKSIKKEIERLGAKKVILVGGENTISKKVFKDLSNGREVERIAGENRYETSLDVAKTAGIKGSILVNGENFPDALVANPLAAKLKKNIILTNGKSLSDEQLKFINQSSNNIILGGKNSMSLEGVKGERIAGSDRYETAIEVANKYFKDSKNTVFTSGRVFADALSAASLFESLKQPIILVDNEETANRAKRFLNGKNMQSVTVIGGENSIPVEVVNSIKHNIPTNKPSSNGGGGGGGGSHKPKPRVEKLADGEFFGSGKGYRSDCRCSGGKANIEVKLTVKENNIENIEITKFMDDTLNAEEAHKRYDADVRTKDYLNKVKEEIQKDNSTGDLLTRLKKCAITPQAEKDVDVASGATYSSIGLVEAIDNAIEQSIKAFNEKTDESKDIILVKKPNSKFRVGDTLEFKQFNMLKRFWETEAELAEGKESAKDFVIEGKNFSKKGIKAEVVTNYYDDANSERFPLKNGKITITEDMIYNQNGRLMLTVEFTDSKTGKTVAYKGQAVDYKTGVYSGTGKGYATEVLDQNDKNYEVEVKFDGRDIEDIQISKYGDDNKFKKEVDAYLKKITKSVKKTKSIESELKKLEAEFAKADENIEEVYAKLAVVDAINNAITRAGNINEYGEAKVNAKDLVIVKTPGTELKMGDDLTVGNFAVERTFWNTELNENQIIETKDFSKNYIMVRIIADYFANPHPVMPGELTEEMVTELNGEKYLVLNFYDRMNRNSAMYFWKIESEVAPTPEPEKPVAPVLEEVSIKNSPESNLVKADEKLDLSDFTLNLKYDNNETKEVSFAEFKENNIETSIENGTEIAKIELNEENKFEVVFTEKETSKTASYTFEVEKEVEPEPEPEKPAKTGLLLEDGDYTIKGDGWSVYMGTQPEKKNIFDVKVEDNYISNIELNTFNDLSMIGFADYKAMFVERLGIMEADITEIYNSDEEDKNQKVVDYLKKMKETLDRKAAAFIYDDDAGRDEDITDVSSGATFTTKSLVDSLLELTETIALPEGATPDPKPEVKPEPKPEPEVPAKESYRDGEAEGEAIGYNKDMPIKVKITTEKNEIKSVDIISNGETPVFFQVAKDKVIESILNLKELNLQNLNKVDTVSGVTKSSNGIKNAVSNALSKLVIK